MKYLGPICIISCSALFGCASLPTLPAGHQIRIADVIAAMECEMLEARRPETGDEQLQGLGKWLKNRRYTALLKLVVTDNNTFKGDVSLNIPVSVGATVVGLGGGLSMTDARTVEINLNGDFEEVDCPTEEAKGGDWKLGGKIGLKDWLQEMYFETRGASGDVGTVRHNLQFIIRSNHALQPKFTLIPVNLNSTGINPSWTSFRQDDHLLAIQVIKKAPIGRGSAPSKPLYVSVVDRLPTVETAQIRNLEQRQRTLLMGNALDEASREALDAQDSQIQTLNKRKTYDSSIQARNKEIAKIEAELERIRRKGPTVPQPRVDKGRNVREEQYQEDRLNNSLIRDRLDILGIQ